MSGKTLAALLAVAVVAFVAGQSLTRPIQAQEKGEKPPANPPGRYQALEVDKELHVIDTSTGQVWQYGLGGRGRWNDLEAPTVKVKK